MKNVVVLEKPVVVCSKKVAFQKKEIKIDIIGFTFEALCWED
jgi:hypothetical protein